MGHFYNFRTVFQKIFKLGLSKPALCGIFCWRWVGGDILLENSWAALPIAKKYSTETLARIPGKFPCGYMRDPLITIQEKWASRGHFAAKSRCKISVGRLKAFHNIKIWGRKRNFDQWHTAFDLSKRTPTSQKDHLFSCKAEVCYVLTAGVHAFGWVNCQPEKYSSVGCQFFCLFDWALVMEEKALERSEAWALYPKSALCGLNSHDWKKRLPSRAKFLVNHLMVTRSAF